MSRKLNTEEDTRAFGLEIAEALEPGDVVALIGDLGTGKTALTKYIAEGLGITEEINSPTFTIVKEYRSGRLPLYHFDVYRLGSGEELLCDLLLRGPAIALHVAVDAHAASQQHQDQQGEKDQHRAPEAAAPFPAAPPFRGEDIFVLLPPPHAFPPSRIAP